MESIWMKGYKADKHAPLEQENMAETIIIGGGIVGILTAYFLSKKRQDVMLVEAGQIGSGQTGRTTAKITVQHDLIYDKLMKNIGERKTRLYAQANKDAIKAYESLIKEEGIECHYENRPAYLYTMETSGVNKLKAEAKAARKVGIETQYMEGDGLKELPFSTKGSLCFFHQAQFHPMEFMGQMVHLLEKQGVKIYENTKVLEVKDHLVITNKGSVWANNIVFATHYPVINVPGFYFLRQHQERSYVLALKTEKELQGMYYGIDENGLSLRGVGELMLLGGGAHRTGKCKDKGQNGKQESVGYEFLRKMAEKYYPGKEVIASWSAQDCMPHDEIPFIGRYSVFRPYWYVATGFKKWGMTNGMVSAKIISNLILKEYDEYEEVFTPKRLHLQASFKNLMTDLGESAAGLSNGAFSKKNRRCPHMGCRLEWNKEEHSWDCPCHGSRFSEEGELLDNPAQIDRKM